MSTHSLLPGIAPSGQAGMWHHAMFTRLLNTARQQVFNAWTDGKQVAAWWGPHGFTNTVCNWEAHQQGRIYIDMIAADGMVFPLTGFFHDISVPESIIFTSRAFTTADGQPQLEVLNTVIFMETAGKTTIILETNVTRAGAAVYQWLEGLHEGWNQSLDKLQAYLETKT